MKTISTSLVLAVLSLHLSAQDTLIYEVFFPSGKHSPETAVFLDIEQWFRQSDVYSASTQIVDIRISGHCDNVGDEESNRLLAQRRIETIQGFVGKLNLKPISTFNFGEDRPRYSNDTPEGRSQNRRVDIELIVRRSSAASTASDDVLSADAEVVPDIPVDCERDTVLIFPQGTWISMKVCHYHRYFADCPIQLTEFISPEAIRNSGYNTRTVDGEQLMTGGMFDISWCRDEDFPVPVQIMLPVPPCELTGQDMYLWTFDRAQSSWAPTGQAFTTVVTTAATNALMRTMMIVRPGSYNCDDLLPLPPPNVKFVARNGLRILDLRVFYDCPQQSVFEYSNGDSQPLRKVRMGLPCPFEEPLLYVRAKDKSGNIYYLHYSDLNEVPFRTRGNCGRQRREQIEANRAMGLPINFISRKYKLRRDQFDLVIPAPPRDAQS